MADLLKLLRLGTIAKAVIECFVSNPPLVQLPFGPFLSVQAQLHPPRSITAHLQKGWPKIGVVQVNVVVIDINGLIPMEKKSPLHFAGRERLRFLLCHADKENLIPYRSLLAH